MCVVGLVTSLGLVAAAVRCNAVLCLPWLAWHLLAILACLGTGTYLALHFTVLAQERNTVRAVLSLIPVLVQFNVCQRDFLYARLDFGTTQILSSPNIRFRF